MQITFDKIQIIIEGLVLVAVVAHIVHMVLSIRDLRKDFKSVTRQIAELERRDLLGVLVTTAANAKQSVIHYTYTFHLPSEEEEMGPLLDAITHTRLQKEHIRFLGPDYTANMDRLYSRKKTGVAVRVNGNVRNTDLRFQIADGRTVVVTVGAASEPSRKGYLIESVFLASILTEWFNSQWSESTEYDEFVRRQVIMVNNYPEVQGLDADSRVDFISKRLGLDRLEVARFLVPEVNRSGA